MTEKENEGSISKYASETSLRNFCRKPQKPGYIEAICEVCEKVYETNEDVYICPDCREKSKK